MMDLIYHQLHMTENTASVPNNLLYLQQVFKRYTIKHAARLCLTPFWLLYP